MQKATTTKKVRPPVERLLLSPDEAAEVLNVGRTTIYDLIRLQLLTSVTIGKRRRIPVDALRIYVDRLVDSQSL